MAQIPNFKGIKPLIKPAGNPYANIQVAPKVAPTVNMVRPTGPAPVAPKDNFLRGSKASSVLPISMPDKMPVVKPQAQTTPSWWDQVKGNITNKIGGAVGATLQQSAQGGKNPLLGTAYNLIVPPETQQSLNNNGLRGTNLLNPNYEPKDWKDAVNVGGSAISTVAGGPITQKIQGGMFLANQLGQIPGAIGEAGLATYATLVTMGQTAMKYGQGDYLGAAKEFSKLAAAVGTMVATNQIWQKYQIDVSPLQDLLNTNILKGGVKNAQAAAVNFGEGAKWTNEQIQASRFGPRWKEMSQNLWDFNLSRDALSEKDLLKGENEFSTGTKQTLKNWYTYLNGSLSSIAHAQPGIYPYPKYTAASLGKMSYNNKVAPFYPSDMYGGVGGQEFDHLMIQMRENGTRPSDYYKAFKYNGRPTPTTLAEKAVDVFKRATGQYKDKDYMNTYIERTGWINDILATVRPKNQGRLSETEWAAAQKTIPYKRINSTLGIIDKEAFRRMLENHYDPEYFGQTSYFP